MKNRFTEEQIIGVSAVGWMNSNQVHWANRRAGAAEKAAVDLSAGQ